MIIVRRILWTLLLCAAAVGASGCASTPLVTLRYYAPKVEVRVEAAVTVGCSEADVPKAVSDVTGAVAQYSADFSRPLEVNLGNLDGQFANTEIGITLTGDGRLSGLNTTQTWQGEKIVTGALEVMAAAASFVDEAEADLCKAVRARAGKEGVWTLKAGARPQLDAPSWTVLDAASAYDQDIYADIQRVSGVLCLVATPVLNSGTAPVTRSGTGRDDVLLPLVQPRTVQLEVFSQVTRDACVQDGHYGTSPSWRAYVPVPQGGERYEIPIPRAAAFGEQRFTLALTDAGAIQTLKYGRQAGGAAALSGLADAIEANDGESTAETVARLKSEADLIAAQQRLARCQTQPTAC